jgi:hypothetical protein
VRRRERPLGGSRGTYVYNGSDVSVGTAIHRSVPVRLEVCCTFLSVIEIVDFIE